MFCLQIFVTMAVTIRYTILIMTKGTIYIMVAMVAGTRYIVVTMATNTTHTIVIMAAGTMVSWAPWQQ